jgi:hypothetical protein
MSPKPWPTETFSGELEAAGERLAIATFSSGTKVVKGGETYYLDVTSADLSILNSGRAPLLREHQFYLDSFLGQVQEAWVSESGRCHAVVRFANLPEAGHLWQLLQQGFPLGVSAGYNVGEIEPFEDGFLIRNWQPYELSLCVRGCDEHATVRCRPLVELAELRDERRAQRLAAAHSARHLALRGDQWRHWAGNSGADAIAAEIGVAPDRLHAPLLAAVEQHLAKLVEVP